jgi:biopolymer transport protein ExbD
MHTRIHAAAQEQHGIDLAPMLDFVINLLIFFIITAVFVKQSGIALNRSPGQNVIDGPDAVSIRVAANGDIFFDNRIVDPRAVRANIERTIAAAPERSVLIVADASAPTGVLVAVADQVRLAGIYDVTLSTVE